MTELVKEVGVIMKETDVINGMNIWLDGLQQGNGFVKLAGVAITTLKRIDYTEAQIEEICQIISNVTVEVDSYYTTDEALEDSLLRFCNEYKIPVTGD